MPRERQKRGKRPIPRPAKRGKNNARKSGEESTDGSTSKSASFRSGSDSRDRSRSDSRNTMTEVAEERERSLGLTPVLQRPFVSPTANNNPNTQTEVHDNLDSPPASHISIGMNEPEIRLQDEDGRYKQDETSIMAFVHKRIFPDLKFVGMGSYHLDYSEKAGTLCQIVLNGCNKQHVNGRELWWRTAAKCVAKTVNRLRSDKVQSLKKAFNGKIGRCCFALGYCMKLTIVFSNFAQNGYWKFIQVRGA
jgi:hypothetical protein